MKLRTTLMAAAIGGFGAAQAAHASLITNGNFSANASSYVTYPGYNSGGSNPADPTGWSNYSISGTTTGVNGADQGFSGNPFRPNTQESPAVDFGFAQDTGSLYYQTFAVTPGQTYSVEYDDGARSTDSSGDADMVSIFDGSSHTGTPINDQSETPSASKFTTEPSFTFTALSSSATIVLANTSTTSTDTVDFTNVIVNAVPEPASLGLLALGAVGLLGRRRH